MLISDVTKTIRSMPSEDRDFQPATSPLDKLRAEIKQCEQFISLCDRIKHLEKIDGSGALQAKKQKLETQRDEALVKIQQVATDIKRHDATLSSPIRTIGTFELEQLKAQIKSEHLRERSLQILVDDSNKTIAQIEKDLANNTEALQQNYSELEQLMETAQLHPNTAVERLRELKEQRAMISETVKANIPTRASNKSIDDSTTLPAVPDGAPMSELEFFKYLTEDFSIARKKVLIVSPFTSVDRAGELMPKLAKLAASGINVVVYTRPPEEHDECMKHASVSVVLSAHRLKITVIQRSGLEHNAVIIDDHIAWEGTVNVLGPKKADAAMRRLDSGVKVRELLRFIEVS